MSHTAYNTSAWSLVIPLYPTPDFSIRAQGGAVHRDMVDGGTGTISGTAKKNGLPTYGLRVKLLERRNLRVVRQTVSGPDGSYSFTNLGGGPYLAVCYELHDPELDCEAHDMIEVEYE